MRHVKLFWHAGGDCSWTSHVCARSGAALASAPKVAEMESESGKYSLSYCPCYNWERIWLQGQCVAIASTPQSLRMHTTIRQWTNFQSFHLVCLYSLWSGKKCCLSPLSSEFIECINMKIIGCATRTKLMDWNNTPFILSLYSLFIVFLICTLRRKWKTIMRYYEPFSY